MRRISSIPPLAGAFWLLAWLATANATPVTAAYHSGGDIPVTSPGYLATGKSVEFQLHFAPPTGSTLTVVRNTALPFITGTFSNLAQGQLVDLAYGGTTYQFVADYFGGDGNDLVLQWAATRPVAWGENISGSLGTGTTRNAYAPEAVAMTGALAGKTILRMACGFGFSLALCSDGSIAAWGENSAGQLGNGSNSDTLVPVAVQMSGALAGKRVIAISAGYDHCLALCSDGTAASWGDNQAGKLGSGTYVASNLPVAIPLGGALAGKSLVAVSAGVYHSMALCSDGSVACWGNNDYGQLGSDGRDPSNVPVAVGATGAFASQSAISVAAGHYASFAVRADGVPVSWGSAIWDLLGTGVYYATPTPTALPTSGALAGKFVRSVSAGYRHALAWCADGSLAGWGQNGDGQLGVQTPEFSNEPMSIPLAGSLAGKSVSTLSAAYEFSLAVCADGTVATWGGVGDPTLGNGDWRGSNIPVSVLTNKFPAGESFMAAFTGTYGVHCLALVARPFVPRISVEESTGVALRRNASTVILGNAAPGTTIGKTFTIRNDGLAPLAIGGVAIEGAQSGDFAITTPPAAVIPAAGSSTMTVSFTANGGFGRSARLRISSNDPDVADFQIDLAATVRTTLEAEYPTPADIPSSASGFSLAGGGVHITLNHPPVTGNNLTLLDNTGLEPIAGAFDNLAHGQMVTLAYGGVSYQFIANYGGGDGNDLVLHWSPNRLMAWGANTIGQLGTGNTTGSWIPVPVAASGILAGKTIFSVGAGASHSIALCSDGTLAGWGSGRLGNGGTTSSKVPVAAGVGGALAGKTVVSIAVGRNHTLALCSDGSLAAWGSNSYGILGDGTTTDRSQPVAVDATGVLANKRVVAIAAGESQSVALCSDGCVATWGYNYFGGLGDGTRIDSDVPVWVDGSGALGGKKVTAIATGYSHSLALCSDGTVVSWGLNRFGQLGSGAAYEYSAIPVAVSTAGALAGKTVVAIAAGDYMSAALCSDQTLVSWGYNSAGNLGNGSNIDSALPVVVDTSGALAGRTPVKLACGGGHVTVVCSDGSLLAWGSNHSGQIGDNSTSARWIAVRANGSHLANGERFAACAYPQGGSHSHAITAIPYAPAMVVEHPAESPLTNGAGVAFGSAPPQGTTTRIFTIRNAGIIPLVISNANITGPQAAEFALTDPPPGSVPPGGSGTFTVTFTSGAGFSRAADLHLTTNDPYAADFVIRLTAQGSGVLNAVYASAADTPLSISDLAASGSQVDFSLLFAPPAGTTLKVADITGTAFIQGRFDNLAHGQTVVLTHAGRSYRFVANYYGGTGNDLVLQWAGVRALAWGRNSSGQLGRGDTIDSKLPVAVTASGTLAGKTILKLAAGSTHGLALCADGTLAAWGSNGSGQLGDGTTTNRSEPVAVNQAGILLGKTVVSIAAGTSFSLALCSDGTVAAWGAGTQGQLGNGAFASSPLPVAVHSAGVLAGKTVVSIAAGKTHAAATCADGTAVTWGSNFDGQLGNGGTSSSSVPVAVATSGVLSGKAVVRVAAGEAHTLALCADGTVAAWGLNRGGRLGNGSTTASATPVAVDASGVLAGRTVTALAAGDEHSLALCADGALIAWGSNSYGQLGNGVMSSTNSRPLLVSSTGGNPTAITAGDGNSLALLLDGSAVSWGLNLYGQLGDGTSTRRSLPGPVACGARLPDERLTAATTGSSANFSLALAAYPFGARLIVATHDNPTVLADGDTAEIGKTVVGTPVSRTFLIRNPGDAALTGLSLSLGGADANRFSLSAPTAVDLPPGGVASFTVTFAPSAKVLQSALIQITADPSSFAGTHHLPVSGLGVTHLEAWRLQYFQTIDNTGSAADSATPRNDGITNLVKFATGMNPTIPGTNPGALSRSGNTIEFTYRRAKAAVEDGVGFTVEWSDHLDANSWTGSGVVEEVTDEETTELVTAKVPSDAASARFVRLRVAKP